MISLGELCSLVSVALLWGATNPLMGRGSSGIKAVKHSNILVQFISELKFLLLNWKFVLPFLANQCGSILFYLTLTSTELSIAVPLTNGLTFIFTSIAGQLLGEHAASKNTYVGMACVLCGVALCLADKMTSV